MATDKSFLQNIKLEISRSLKLQPYERIVFHRILGVLKSEAAQKILTDELDRGRDIRSSAISVLVNFSDDSLVETLFPYLDKDIYEADRVRILSLLVERGGSVFLPKIREYIESFKEGNANPALISLVFDYIRKNGKGDEETLNYLINLINSGEYPAEVIYFAIRALSVFGSLSIYEKILNKKNDYLSLAVFDSINLMLISLASESASREGVDERLFTYSPDSEDRLILEIRVLLGKATADFDSFSNRTKTAFMAAMISCNHREHLIYIMKGLTSGDPELIRFTLYTVLLNVERMRDPDKLFRNLIALSTETYEDNEIIISIIVKYFTLPLDNRQFNLLKDKMFSYFVVTLDTYYEMYRKEFMITEVAENSYPENIKRIRSFILEKLTPGLRKKIVQFLFQEESSMTGHLISEIGNWLQYVDEKSRDDLALLIEVLFESDKKSREISAGRLEDINFEKRYLKKRILRVCRLISELQINDAASSLVNIYNYLKKYPEPEIMNEVEFTLASLNYSYMLGEVEVTLTTGNPEERKHALDLITLFTEQRSLNILLEFIQNTAGSDTEFLERAVEILLQRDIKGNLTALSLLKHITENHPDSGAAYNAVLGIGLAGYETDIEYLNSLFYSARNPAIKEAAVRAIGSIISLNHSVNRKEVIKSLQNCLKDPGIRIRIYACLLLAKLGDKEAVRSIRDMLVIKNKDIQRDILTILGDLKSIEFAFFLLSLLKEEYGISEDIVSVYSRLPLEDMQEIDGFVINIFRKYEAPDIEGFDRKDETVKEIMVPGLSSRERTLLKIEVADIDEEDLSITDLIDLKLTIKKLIVAPVTEKGGEIAGISHLKVSAAFDEPERACEASLEVSGLLREYNRLRQTKDRIKCSIRIISGELKTLHSEVIDYPDYQLKNPDAEHFTGRVLTDRRSFELAEKSFNMFPLPLTLFNSSADLFDLMTVKNYKEVSDSVFSRIVEERESREKARLEIEAETKKLRMSSRAPSSVAVARDIDAIGSKLKKELDEIEKYVQRRATDRELIKNVKKMLDNVYNLYKVEVSRIIIE